MDHETSILDPFINNADVRHHSPAHASEGRGNSIARLVYDQFSRIRPYRRYVSRGSLIAHTYKAGRPYFHAISLAASITVAFAALYA